MIVTIGSEADVVASLAEDRAGQSRAIGVLDPWGTTALHDATIAALDRLGPERGRQALVVFSDGTDRYSLATAADVMMRARRTSALIYPIALGRTRPPWLAELAVLTGGRSFHLRDTRDLERTLSLVARELRSQYLLGYEPDDQAAGPPRWRSIAVTLAQGPRGARVRARSGYTSD
jgi:Ca-activated chloride channel homolog